MFEPIILAVKNDGTLIYGRECAVQKAAPKAVKIVIPANAELLAAPEITMDATEFADQYTDYLQAKYLADPKALFLDSELNEDEAVVMGDAKRSFEIGMLGLVPFMHRIVDGALTVVAFDSEMSFHIIRFFALRGHLVFSYDAQGISYERYIGIMLNDAGYSNQFIDNE